jgi:hypothetical protein
MAMSGLGMVAYAVGYLVPLILLIVILVKVNGIARTLEKGGPRG